MSRRAGGLGLGALSVLLIVNMLTAGCTGIMDGEDANPPEGGELPAAWDELSKRTIASPHLIQYQSCEELEMALKFAIEEEYRVRLLQAIEEQYYYGWGWPEDDVAMMDGDAESAPSSAGADSQSSNSKRVEGEDYSGTNNQESGVDEADFVKTDGYYLYFLNNNQLEIMGMPGEGELTKESTTKIEGNALSMMLDGDNLVIISSVNSWSIPQTSTLAKAMGWSDEYYHWRASSLIKFTVVDISNKTAPEVSRELFIEGSYITSREVDGVVRTVSHAWMDIRGLQSWLDLPNGYWNLDYDDPLRLELRQQAAYEAIKENQETLINLHLSDIVPQVYERVGDEVSTHQMTNDECADFTAPEDVSSRGFNSIFTLDLSSEALSFEADHMVGNWPQVYASKEVMILSENSWDWWWYWDNDDLDTSTNIHTFDIGDASTTTYTGSGRVDGTILNQFSLSEHNGIIRAATTTGQWARWWMSDPEPMENHVVTLSHTVDVETGEQKLYEVGRLDGIALNETIWSCRFVEDKAYIVTFRNMDPLWTIDLSDPAEPTIMGELHIPGVSTYIHPVNDERILTIGYGPAGEDGLGLDWSNTRIQLFNVTNFSDPQVQALKDLAPVDDIQNNGWTYSSSEATYEHKAFQFWKGQLAIPLSTYRYNSWNDEQGGYHWNYQYISKLVILNITDDGITTHGEVDHSHLFDRDENHYWWSSNSIRRSIFMGDHIYAISSAGVTSTNLTTMEETDAIELEQPTSYHSYYDKEEESVVAESSDEEKSSEEGHGDESEAVEADA